MENSSPIFLSFFWYNNAVLQKVFPMIYGSILTLTLNMQKMLWKKSLQRCLFIILINYYNCCVHFFPMRPWPLRKMQYTGNKIYSLAWCGGEIFFFFFVILAIRGANMIREYGKFIVSSEQLAVITRICRCKISMENRDIAQRPETGNAMRRILCYAVKNNEVIRYFYYIECGLSNDILFYLEKVSFILRKRSWGFS